MLILGWLERLRGELRLGSDTAKLQPQSRLCSPKRQHLAGSTQELGPSSTKPLLSPILGSQWVLLCIPQTISSQGLAFALENGGLCSAKPGHCWGIPNRAGREAGKGSTADVLTRAGRGHCCTLRNNSRLSSLLWASLPGLLLTPECVFLSSLWCHVLAPGSPGVLQSPGSEPHFALCEGVMSVSASLPSSPPNSPSSPDRPSETTARKCRSPRGYCTPNQISLRQCDIKTFIYLFFNEKERKMKSGGPQTR